MLTALVCDHEEAVSALRKAPAVVFAAIGLAIGAAGAVIVLAALPDDGTNSTLRLLVAYAVWVVLAAGTLVLGDRVVAARTRSDRDGEVAATRRDAPAEAPPVGDEPAEDDSASADR